jgi:hypothetical protein
VMIGAGSALLLLSGCGAPDPQALQKLACQKVANTIDLQSVSQLDTLRKALGLAPGVDPIESCRALGVPMEPGAGGEGAGGEGAAGEGAAGEGPAGEGAAGEGAAGEGAGENGAAEAGEGEGGSGENESQ